MAVSSATNQNTVQQATSSGTTKTSSRNTGELGKDDFLNLLVTQLRYQDPLNPTDDKEFIAQMAQFSSLEQMQNMNSSFTAVKAFNMIGKQVTGTISDTATGTLQAVQGTVTNVKMSSGKTYVEVNGLDVPLEQVTEVTDLENPYLRDSNISQYTNLIGFTAKGAVYDGGTGAIVGVKGTVKELQKGDYEDYAIMDGVEVDISDILENQTSTDPDYRRKYLEENNGKEIQVNVIDRTTGRKVGVKATLREDSWQIGADGRITAILDNLHVALDSIENISK